MSAEVFVGGSGDDAPRDERGEATQRPLNRYKAFVSYSHAADGQLAAAVQRGLQRIATPWYRPAPYRVFRDATSLSATPELWPTIEHELAQSEFFILLASPAAAASAWVGREVDWWCTHREASKMLVGLTDGEMAWDVKRGAFDPNVTTALPRQLYKAWTEEPKWVDLRWARGGDDVSLRHARFRNAVADLAAPLHGLPRDELANEDARQQRRAARFRVVAMTGLVLLTCIAALTAAYAVRQQGIAETQRDLAETNRDTADSRRLAAQASANVEPQVDLSLLLSMEALRLADTSESRAALLAGLLRTPSNPRHLDDVSGFVSAIAVDEQGRLIAAGDSEGWLTLWHADNHERVQTLEAHREGVTAVAFSSDGQTIASAANGETHVRLQSVDGEEVETRPLLAPADAPVTALAFSPNGKFLAAGTIGGSVLVWDLSSQQDPQAWGGGGDLSVELYYFQALRFTSDSQLVAVDRFGEVVQVDVETGDASMATPPRPDGNVVSVALDRSGTRVGLGYFDGTVAVIDISSGEPVVDRLQASNDIVRGLAFSPDGTTLVSGRFGGEIDVWNIEADGRLDDTITIEEAPVDHLIVPRGALLLSATERDTDLLLHTLEGGYDLAQAIDGVLAKQVPDRWVADLVVAPGSATVTAAQGSQVSTWDFRPDETSPRSEHKLSGEVLNLSPDAAHAAVLDGDRVAVVDLRRDSVRFEVDVSDAVGALAAFSEDGRAVAVAHGQRVTVHRLDGDVVMDVESSEQVSAAAYHAAVGRLVVGTSGGALEVWEGTSQQPAWRRERAHFGGQDPYVRQVSISDDGDLVASTGGEETMLWDASNGQPFGVPVSRNAAMPHAFSPDGRYLAVGPTDGGIRLWDVQSNSWLSEPIAPKTGQLTDLAYGGPEQLMGTTVSGSVVLLDFDIQRWRRHACELANRDLTVAEWSQYLGRDRPYRGTCSDAQ